MKPSRTLLFVALSLLLAVLFAPAPVAGASDTANINSITYAGDAVVNETAGIAWTEGSVNVVVTVRNTGSAGQHTVCIAGGGSESCSQKYISENQQERVVIGANAFQSGPGNRSLDVRVVKGINANADPVATAQTTLTTYNPQGDADGDGLRNRDEVKAGTRLDVRDSDKDGLEDGPEVNNHGTDPLNPDTDGDGFRDSEEVLKGTDSLNPDSDGDSLTDGQEIENGSDPTVPDTDGDGLNDDEEVNRHGTDPTVPDTDGDGLNDGEEVNQHGTDPTEPDSDGDGLDDDEEVVQDTDPTESDSDGDGLSDGQESELVTDPTDPDTDNDLLNDGLEVRIGTNPDSAVSALFLGVVALLALLGVAHVLVRRGLGSVENHPVVPERLRPAVRRGRRTAERASSWIVDKTSLGSADRHASNGHDTERTIETPADAREPPEPTVLSDEEKTIKLLREHGGRLPQREITEQSEWSKSKVSRLLSKMEEEGLITKINLGRENLIALNDDVPDGMQSPLDDPG